MSVSFRRAPIVASALRRCWSADTPASIVVSFVIFVIFVIS